MIIRKAVQATTATATVESIPSCIVYLALSMLYPLHAGLKSTIGISREDFRNNSRTRDDRNRRAADRQGKRFNPPLQAEPQTYFDASISVSKPIPAISRMSVALSIGLTR